MRKIKLTIKWQVSSCGKYRNYDDMAHKTIINFYSYEINDQ